jgi:serine protease Do
VTLHNGETYPASIVGGNSDQDIAIIKVNAKGLKAATLGDSSTVSVGDTAVAIGNPLGQLGGTATAGIISALDRTLEIEGRQLTLLQTDAAINGGNSGGGLFNSKGELIGIVDAKSSGVGIEGLAFAIPINAVSEDINDIIENGKISTRPVVGITITDVSEENAPYYQLDTPGVYIAQITGENAQKAGFRCSGMEFATELVGRFADAGLSICQVPVRLRRTRRLGPGHLRTIPDGMRHLALILFWKRK